MGCFEIDHERIIFEQFDEETVVVNIESGYYYSLSPSGFGILELLRDGVHASALPAALFADEAERAERSESVQVFVARLLAEGIVRERAEAPTIAGGERAPLYAAGAPYAPPALERYDEVRDLLLIDPVHQVDPSFGWPKTREEAAAVEAEA